MATTIRDVVVKLNIEQNQAALKPPDTSAAVVAIDEYINALKESIQVIRVDHTSAVDALKQAVIDYGNTTSAILDKLSKEWDKSKPDPGHTPLPLPDKKEVEDTAKAVADANLKMLDSFKQAGEGAFTLARGIAFLTSSSDEDFKETLLVIAKFQGAFDLFKGGAETVRGLAEAARVLTTAQAAQATAQTAVGVSATAAAGGMTAMQIAMGPIGIALASIAAIAGIFVYAFSKVREVTQDSTKAWRDAANAVDSLRRSKEATAAGEAARQSAELRGSQEATAQLSRQVQMLEKMREASARTAQDAAIKQGIIMAGDGDQGRLASATALEVAARLDIADALADEKESRVAMLKQQESASELAQREYEQQLQTLEVLREKIKSEDQRLQSMDAQFASLNAMERKELEILSIKAKSGQLTREELLTLQRLGGSAVADYVGGKLGEMGRADGSREIFSRFGVDIGAERARAQTEVDVIAQGAGARSGESAEAALQRKVDQLITARQKQSDQVADMLDKLTEMERKNNERLDVLQFRIERNTQ